MDIFGDPNSCREEEVTAILPLRGPVDTCSRVLRCAQLVHRSLGPGLPDLLYARALGMELSAEHLAYERDAFLEVRYRGAIVGKRTVSFLLDELAVDVLAAPTSDLEELRLRAASLLVHRPGGLALDFGRAWLQSGRADARPGRARASG
jgi:GxxExxY protein